MKYRFFLSILFLAFIFLVSSSFASYIIDKGLKKTNEDVYGKINFYLNDTVAYDVLFMGSSRTLGAVNPAIIDSITGYNSYNGGVNGMTGPEIKLLVTKYLESHPAPKHIVLNIDYNIFDLETEIFENQKYYPYAQDKEIKEVIAPYDKNLEKFQSFPFLKTFYYSDVIWYISLKALLGLDYKTANTLKKGYRHNFNSWNDIDDQAVAREGVFETPYSNEGIKLLEDIVQICLEKKVKPIFIFSPIFRAYLDKFSNLEIILSEVSRIATTNKIPFLRYDNLKPIVLEKKYFYDVNHLNYEGASAFSTHLAQDLVNLSAENSTKE